MEYFDEPFVDSETLENHILEDEALPRGWRKHPELLLQVLRGLGRLHCTEEEIIAFLGISAAEWREIVKADPTIMAMYAYGQTQGKMAIRRKQMQRAMSGSDAMLKHVGRHVLGQHDKLTVHNGGMTLAERQELLEEVERRHEAMLVDVSPVRDESANLIQ